MSVDPGATLNKDPSAKLVYEFDWTDWLGDTDQIASSTFTIAGPDTVLAKDSEVIITGNKKTQVRLLAGTKGKKYTLVNHIITNGTPVQEDDRTVFIKIVEQ